MKNCRLVKKYIKHFFYFPFVHPIYLMLQYDTRLNVFFLGLLPRNQLHVFYKSQRREHKEDLIYFLRYFNIIYMETSPKSETCGLKVVFEILIIKAGVFCNSYQVDNF